MNFSLRIAVLSEDAELLDRLRRVCAQRAHSLVELVDLRWLPASDVLLLNADDAFDRVDELRAAHPATTIAFVGEGRERSVDGYRVLARTWGDHKLGDELELAWIGIPARTGDDASLDKQVG